MAATVDIREKNGAGETATVKTSLTVRFKAADDANADLNDPIVRPPSGTAYSYEKYLRLNVSVAPTGAITSPRAYSDGANNLGTGVSLFAGVVGSYTQPVVTDSATATVDLFTYTSGSPRTMDVTNTGPYSGTGDIADYLVMQIDVADTASPGLTSAETLTIAYDET